MWLCSCRKLDKTPIILSRSLENAAVVYRSLAKLLRHRLPTALGFDRCILHLPRPREVNRSYIFPFNEAFRGLFLHICIRQQLSSVFYIFRNYDFRHLECCQALSSFDASFTLSWSIWPVNGFAISSPFADLLFMSRVPPLLQGLVCSYCRRTRR